MERTERDKDTGLRRTTSRSQWLRLRVTLVAGRVTTRHTVEYSSTWEEKKKKGGTKTTESC